MLKNVGATSTDSPDGIRKTHRRAQSDVSSLTASVRRRQLKIASELTMSNMSKLKSTSSSSLTPDIEVWNPFEGDNISTQGQPDADKEFDEFLTIRNSETVQADDVHDKVNRDLFGAKPFSSGDSHARILEVPGEMNFENKITLQRTISAENADNFNEDTVKTSTNQESKNSQKEIAKQTFKDMQIEKGTIVPQNSFAMNEFRGGDKADNSKVAPVMSSINAKGYRVFGVLRYSDDQRSSADGSETHAQDKDSDSSFTTSEEEGYEEEGLGSKPLIEDDDDVDSSNFPHGDNVENQKTDGTENAAQELHPQRLKGLVSATNETKIKERASSGGSEIFLNAPFKSRDNCQSVPPVSQADLFGCTPFHVASIPPTGLTANLPEETAHSFNPFDGAPFSSPAPKQQQTGKDIFGSTPFTPQQTKPPPSDVTESGSRLNLHFTQLQQNRKIARENAVRKKTTKNSSPLDKATRLRGHGRGSRSSSSSSSGGGKRDTHGSGSSPNGSPEMGSGERDKKIRKKPVAKLDPFGTSPFAGVPDDKCTESELDPFGAAPFIKN